MSNQGLPFTTEQFTEAMKKAVEMKGADYVYDREAEGIPSKSFKHEKTCAYRTEDGQPSCLIGHALYLIDPALMPERDDATSALGVFHRIAGMGVGLVEVRRRKLTSAAQCAQNAQDNGHTWGKALEAYLQVIERSKEVVK